MQTSVPQHSSFLVQPAPRARQHSALPSASHVSVAASQQTEAVVHGEPCGTHLWGVGCGGMGGGVGWGAGGRVHLGMHAIWAERLSHSRSAARPQHARSMQARTHAVHVRATQASVPQHWSFSAHAVPRARQHVSVPPASQLSAGSAQHCAAVHAPPCGMHLEGGGAGWRRRAERCPAEPSAAEGRPFIAARWCVASHSRQLAALSCFGLSAWQPAGKLAAGRQAGKPAQQAGSLASLPALGSGAVCIDARAAGLAAWQAARGDAAPGTLGHAAGWQGLRVASHGCRPSRSIVPRAGDLPGAGSRGAAQAANGDLVCWAGGRRRGPRRASPAAAAQGGRRSAGIHARSLPCGGWAADRWTRTLRPHANSQWSFWPGATTREAVGVSVGVVSV